MKCYQLTVTHCVTTNEMNHPIGLHIYREIWEKTVSSKSYTSFIFITIWNVTSDSRTSQKSQFPKAEYRCWFDTHTKILCFTVIWILYKHKKRVLYLIYSRNPCTHKCKCLCCTHQYVNPNPRVVSRFTTRWKGCLLQNCYFRSWRVVCTVWLGET
jgi:hypothetical protein